MTTIIAVKNFGVLGSEYRSLWSDDPMSNASEYWEIDIPNGVAEVSKNSLDRYIIKPVGTCSWHFIHEIISSDVPGYEEEPCLRYYDRYGYYRYIPLNTRRVR